MSTTLGSRPTTPLPPSTPSLRPWPRSTVVSAVVLGAGALLLSGTVGYGLGATRDDQPVSFTDSHDRACTSTAFGLDCDFLPAESRLDGFLEGLSTTPGTTTTTAP